MKLVKPILGRLTQGVIFSCARAERYSNHAVFGLVITARCDVDQDKFPVLNYLPVVRFDDWLSIDGLEILGSRAIKETSASITNQLKSAGVATSILNTLTVREVLDQIFLDQAAPKKVKSCAKEFSKLTARHETYEQLAGNDTERLKWLNSEFSVLKRGMVRELIQQKLNGYYFLPAVSDDTSDHGYVVMMREVSFLPRNLALRIAGGIDKTDNDLKQLEWRNYLHFFADDFSMPVAEIPSPEIEHLLQTFSMLFGRIGLPDYSAEFISGFCDRPLVQTSMGAP